MFKNREFPNIIIKEGLRWKTKQLNVKIAVLISHLLQENKSFTLKKVLTMSLKDVSHVEMLEKILEEVTVAMMIEDGNHLIKELNISSFFIYKN